MSLWRIILKGGTYLAFRQAAGMVISFGGIVLLTRMIGPAAYGVYAAAHGIYFFLFTVGQLGIPTYLIRRADDPGDEDYNQAFTLLLIIGVSVVTLSIIAVPVIDTWVNIEGFSPAAAIMFGLLPLHLLLVVPLARLERSLNYKVIAWVELGGLGMFFFAALSLAYYGFGPWAPIIGWWMQHLTTGILFYAYTGYRPRITWKPALIRDMVRYGASYSTSTWVWRLRELVNPLIVGRYAGADAVGYIALTIRIVEALSFVKNSTWRLSIAALAKMQGDNPRLTRAIGEGMRLQMLGIGPLLVIFALIMPWLIPLFFGEQWLPVIFVFPFVALGSLFNAVFNLHSSALYVDRRNNEVTVFHLVNVLLLAGGALLLVPSFGYMGYAWSEMISVISYAVVHFFIVRRVGRPNYGIVTLWIAAFGTALFFHYNGIVVFIPLVITLLIPQTWKTIIGYTRNIWGMRTFR
jgi:O-antigen/teichoic acid export membrane protein